MDFVPGAYALQIFRRCICVADKSDTLMHRRCRELAGNLQTNGTAYIRNPRLNAWIHTYFLPSLRSKNRILLASPLFHTERAKNNNTHHNYIPRYTTGSSPPTMANDPPAVKPWGQTQKDALQDLIADGNVDITRTDDTTYIDRVRHQHFRERDRDNFRRNFRSYARSCEIGEHFEGYRRRLALAAGGEGKQITVSIILLYNV